MLTLTSPSRASKSLQRGFQYARASGLRSESYCDFEDRRQDFALAMLVHGDSPLGTPLAENEPPSPAMLERCKSFIRQRYGHGQRGGHIDIEAQSHAVKLSKILSGRIAINLNDLTEEYSGIVLTALCAGRVLPGEVRICKGKLFIKIGDKLRRKQIRQTIRLLGRANWVNPVHPIGQPSTVPPSGKPYCPASQKAQTTFSSESFGMYYHH